jgi:4-hydroxybenzoate polyprenyltransferase
METRSENTPKSIFKRLKIYTDEMFPIVQYIPYIIALYVCLNFSSQILDSNTIVIDTYSVVGFVTAFFMMLLMRTFDDLKDFELDFDLFPWRSIPQRLILKSDIQKLSLFCLLVVLVINICLGQDTLLVLGIVLLYCIGTFKWFFAEKIHREKVFLTMVTHQPIPYSINFYLIHTGLASGGVYNDFSLHHFYLLLIFSLPVTAWEVSRKIRSADKETHYETFSSIFGAKGAAIIAFVPLLITSGLVTYLAMTLDVYFSFYILIAVLTLIMAFFYLRFIINPIDKNNILLKVTMGFTSLLFFGFLGHIIDVAEISFNF